MSEIYQICVELHLQGRNDDVGVDITRGIPVRYLSIFSEGYGWSVSEETNQMITNLNLLYFMFYL